MGECPHLSADGTGNYDEWGCAMCGEVYTYVEDPDGNITMTDDDGEWKRWRRVTVVPAPTQQQPEEEEAR